MKTTITQMNEEIAIVNNNDYIAAELRNVFASITTSKPNLTVHGIIDFAKFSLYRDAVEYVADKELTITELLEDNNCRVEA